MKGELVVLPIYIKEVKPVVVINLEDYSIKYKIFPFSQTNHRVNYSFLKDVIVVHEITMFGYDSRYMVDVEDEKVSFKESLKN